jgi:HemY protein
VTARPDRAWVADGIVSDTWRPVSPVSGRLDAFVWTTPQESLAAPVSPVLEAEAIEPGPEAVNEPEPVASLSAPPAEPLAVPVSEPAEAPAPAPEPAQMAEPAPAVPFRQVAAPRKRARVARSGTPTEVVMPLPQLPDDPGPEGEIESAGEEAAVRK